MNFYINLNYQLYIKVSHQRLSYHKKICYPTCWKELRILVNKKFFYTESYTNGISWTLEILILVKRIRRKKKDWSGTSQVADTSSVGWLCQSICKHTWSRTYYVQSTIPGVVGMQRKASTVYDLQRSLQSAFKMDLFHYANRCSWLEFLGRVMERRRERYHIVEGRRRPATPWRLAESSRQRTHAGSKCAYWKVQNRFWCLSISTCKAIPGVTPKCSELIWLRCNSLKILSSIKTCREVDFYEVLAFLLQPWRAILTTNK